MKFMLLVSLISTLSFNVAFAEDVASSGLQNITVNYSKEKWLAKDLDVDETGSSGIILANVEKLFLATILDKPEMEELYKNDDPVLTRAALISITEDRIRANYDTFSKMKAIVVIPSAKMPGNWVCSYHVVKKNSETPETSYTHCAALDKDYWVYVSLASPHSGAKSNMDAVQVLLDGISPKLRSKETP